MKRSVKEMFIKRVGKWLGAGYRFHRHCPGDAWPHVFNMLKAKGALQYMPSNFKRIWTFEWWEKVPGNPLNKYFNDNREELQRSECKCEDFPESVCTKDEAVDYALFRSGFLKDFGIGAKSYEELELIMTADGAPDHAPYSENTPASFFV